MRFLLPFDNLRALVRVPVKALVFVLVVVAVCYPYPRLLLRHLQHWRDPNALLDPSVPALQPLVEELRQTLPADLAPRERLSRVQRFVLERVPYAWDWDTWGMADYMPTLAEVLEMGREDCDGRAVVAASLLRALGDEATIVTDLSHVWVRTPMGDLMGPGKADALVATDRGVAIRLRGLLQLPTAMAYGLAVFPLWREVIMVLAAWWLLLRRRTGVVRAAVALILAGAALGSLRAGGADYQHPQRVLQLLGLAFGTATLVLLLWPRKRTRATLQPP